MNEQSTEQMIRSKNLNAPRLSPASIDAVIAGRTFTALPGGKCIVCELTLMNGFTVRGEASVVSKENFDREVGEKVSFENARRKVWELEGYLLQQRLFDRAGQDTSESDRMKDARGF